MGRSALSNSTPKALNALNLDMVRELHPLLDAYNESSNVRLIVFRGVGGIAFCAGGDIKALHDNGKDPQKRIDAVRFFEEYR